MLGSGLPSGRVVALEKTSMTETSTCIAIYPTVPVVRQALAKLQAEGINLHQVSIVGKGYHDQEQLIGFYTVSQGISYCGFQSVLWVDLWPPRCVAESQH